MTRSKGWKVQLAIMANRLLGQLGNGVDPLAKTPNLGH